MPHKNAGLCPEIYDLESLISISSRTMELAHPNRLESNLIFWKV